MFSRLFGRRSGTRKSNLRKRDRPEEQRLLEEEHDAYRDLGSELKLVVAAIDIGTAYSGYAFAFVHDHVYDVTDPERIHVNTWEFDGGSRSFYKTPTCLLLNPDGTMHSFGREAIAKYNTLVDENQHHGWYFFTQFKMTLHQEEEISGNIRLRDESGKEMDALQVFGYSIQYLKDHLLGVVSHNSPGLQETDVKWVITVPAIWADSAKKFMRQAAQQAGIRREDIEIALEPESASLYCRSMKVFRDSSTKDKPKLMTFQPGSVYMVVDCGGGTVDVTVHELLKDNRLKELHSASGGDWGGSKVNKAFLNFISHLIGPTEFYRFTTEFKSDYLLLLEDFEIKKRTFRPEFQDSVTVRIPASLNNILNSNEVDLTKEQGCVILLRDKLKISAEKFKSFFELPIKEIVTHVQGLRKVIEKPIKAILMVGGFSESPILQQAMKESCGKSVHVVIPIDASLCVLKGAVLYGFSPCSVAFRSSRYTYGVAMTEPFDEKKHPERKKIIIDRSSFCDDVFDKHVEIHQEIPSGVPLQERKYYPFTDDDQTFSIRLYRSTSKDPKFVNDPGCSPVGIFEIPVDQSLGETKWERALQVQMVFGASDIHVRTIQSNKKYREAIFKMNP